MANQDLLAYIQKKQKEGVDRNMITAELLKTGWRDQDITEAFLIIDTGGVSVSSSVPEPPTQTASYEGVGVTFRKTFNTYKENFGVLAGIMLVPVVAGLLIAQVLATIGTNMVVLSISSVALIVFFSVAQLAVVYSLCHKTDITESYNKAISLILSYYWISILATAIVAIGLILFVIPGVIFSIWFVFTVFVLVAEGGKGVDALARSREYVRGYWYSIFWKLLVGGIVVSVVGAILIALASVIDGLTGFQVVDGIVRALASLFMLTYWYHSYINMYEVKAGNKEVKINKKLYIVLASFGVLVMVVVPIVIATVVTSSLDGARIKGQDASIKANVSSMRSIAELYYDMNDGYEGLCTTDNRTVDIIERVEQYSDTVICEDSPVEWKMSATLVGDPDSVYCVYSSGYFHSEEDSIDSDISCPE